MLPAVWYGNKTETKCVLYLQDIWPEALMMAGATQSKWVIKSVEKMVKYIYKQDPEILVPSEAYIPWIRRLNQEVNIRYLPQYAEDFYQPQEKAKFDVFKEDKFRIMFTGNIGTSQGLEQLVDLINAVKEEVFDQALECVLIGNGRAKKALIETIESKGIGQYFTFIDSIPAEEIPNYLAHADLAYLSFKENELFNAVIPAKLQSYMACGVPVLGLVEGVSANIIKEAEGGFVISHLAPDKSAQFLNAIRTSKERLKKMGENNVRYANQNFNKELLMKEFEAMYLSEDRHV
jgi:glycosyltransferase involved in cell wall biosynthesis